MALGHSPSRRPISLLRNRGVFGLRLHDWRKPPLARHQLWASGLRTEGRGCFVPFTGRHLTKGVVAARSRHTTRQRQSSPTGLITHAKSCCLVPVFSSLVVITCWPSTCADTAKALRSMPHPGYLEARDILGPSGTSELAKNMSHLVSLESPTAR